MSRAYQVRIAESIRRNVKVGDGFQMKLELLDIACPEVTADLLEKELIALGFEKCDEEDTVSRTDEDGVVTRVNTKTRTVDISSEVEKEINLDIETDIWAEDDRPKSEEQGRERVRRGLEKQADSCAEKLQQDITSVLEGKLNDIRKELDQVTNRVTATALKQKAASLGEIQEISEDPATGSLTIRVKL